MVVPVVVPVEVWVVILSSVKVGLSRIMRSSGGPVHASSPSRSSRQVCENRSSTLKPSSLIFRITSGSVSRIGSPLARYSTPA